MTDISVGQGEDRRAPKPGEASPEDGDRGLVVDESYAQALAEDLAVDPELAMKAFLGEPRKRALRVVGWVLVSGIDDPDRRGRMIQAWAQKRKAGAWSLRPRRHERPKRDVDDDGDGRYVEVAKRLAVLWGEHPELLAEALVKLEQATVKNGGR